MYNTLTTEQKRQVDLIVIALGDVYVQSISRYTEKLLPDSLYRTHLDFLRDLIAFVLDGRDTTAQKFLDAGLLPTLSKVITCFCKWCNAYITQGDRIPTDRIGDIFTLAINNTAYDFTIN